MKKVRYNFCYIDSDITCLVLVKSNKILAYSVYFLHFLNSRNRHKKEYLTLAVSSDPLNDTFVSYSNQVKCNINWSVRTLMAPYSTRIEYCQKEQ